MHASNALWYFPSHGGPPSSCNQHSWSSQVVNHYFCFPPPVQEKLLLILQSLMPYRHPGEWGHLGEFLHFPCLISIPLWWCAGFPGEVIDLKNSLLAVGICPGLYSLGSLFLDCGEWGWSILMDSLGSTVPTEVLTAHFWRYRWVEILDIVITSGGTSGSLWMSN